MTWQANGTERAGSSSGRDTCGTGAGIAAALSLLLGVVACHPGAVSPEEIAGPFVWGSVDNVTHVRHLWLSGQPDQAALERAKAEGIGVVVDLRDPGEHDWDEQSAVQALGMTYYNVPVRRGQPFDPEAFERIEALVAQHHDEQVWLHCSSSNRAAGWLATHLVVEHGMSVDDALVVGRKTGVTKEPIEENVRLYLAPPGD